MGPPGRQLWDHPARRTDMWPSARLRDTHVMFVDVEVNSRGVQAGLPQMVGGIANGVGPVVAATLLTTVGDNPDRIGGKAQFAVLCGLAPIPASSGQRVRHRLSRGGDRRDNHAIHRIVLVRLCHHETRTMVYFDCRRAEGLSDCDINTSPAASSVISQTRSSPC